VGGNQDVGQVTYGILSIVIGIVVLVVTCWIVDRLDQREPGEKRVAWRPWYRTAVACGYYATMGLVTSFGRDRFAVQLVQPGNFGLLIEFAAMVGFPVLIALQLLTRSSIRVQVVEIFAVCLSFPVGAELARRLDLTTVDVQRLGLVEFSLIFGLWFGMLTTIAALCTLGTRAVLRLLGFPDR